MSVIIHVPVLSLTLHLGNSVPASWVGLLFVKTGGRSDKQLAAGAKQQLGETGCSPQLREGQTSLCACVCVQMGKCAARHEYLS